MYPQGHRGSQECPKVIKGHFFCKIMTASSAYNLSNAGAFYSLRSSAFMLICWLQIYQFRLGTDKDYILPIT